MCEYFGYEVKRLKRTRIMNINLDIKLGRYRELTKTELKKLEQLLKESSKTHNEDF